MSEAKRFYKVLPHQSLGFSFPGEGRKCSDSLDVIKAGLPKRLVVDPDSLQVEIGWNELVGLVSLPGGPLEVCP